MTRKRIYVILSRERGTMAQIARRLGINRVNIHNYLRGRIESKTIAQAVEAEAQRLLVAKRKRNAAA